MDKIDRKILSLLQENARYPLKYLAQKVFLSSPAVSTRIERMEKAALSPAITQQLTLLHWDIILQHSLILL